MSRKKALFLDIDGTLIVDKHYLSDPDGVELITGARDFLHDALALGYELFLHSNQSGISRGYYTIEDTNRCNERMFELLELPGVGFREMCMAVEAPDQEQVYRKPSPRFILEMTEKYNLDKSESWMIGDKIEDLQAGLNAGVRTAWVATGKPKSADVERFIKENKTLELESLSDFFSVIAQS